ncbi:unnamed protein product [Boreogadus saida]
MLCEEEEVMSLGVGRHRGKTRAQPAFKRPGSDSLDQYPITGTLWVPPLPSSQPPPTYTLTSIMPDNGVTLDEGPMSNGGGA